jgi:hypothetical protein
MPVTTVFVGWRRESGMMNPAPISSTGRPFGARAQAPKTEKPPHRTLLIVAAMIAVDMTWLSATAIGRRADMD